MAATARQMNLAALQQRDPYITAIVDTGSQVALYSFSSKSNEWEKTDIEGTLFVYTRSAAPINGFMILNRLGLNDLIEPINKNLEFQLQDPFLLYRNEKGSIYGVWFYDKDECARIGQLMNSLVQVAIETYEKKDNIAGRQRRASESDTMFERSSSRGEQPAARPPGPPSNAAAPGAAGNVDILQMLSKAQDEYDKTKRGDGAGATDSHSPPAKASDAAGGRKPEPKPLIDNPNAAATKSSDLIRPRALKGGHSLPRGHPQEASSEDMDGLMGEAGAAPDIPQSAGTTAISLDTLFRKASQQHEAAKAQENRTQGERAIAEPATSPGQLLLQRLMSNPGTTVEEIERRQRGEIPRDQMPQPAGAEAPSGLPNGGQGLGTGGGPSLPPRAGVGVGAGVSQPTGMSTTNVGPEPDSPNTAIKRTLNLLPPASLTVPPPSSEAGKASPEHTMPAFGLPSSAAVHQSMAQAMVTNALSTVHISGSSASVSLATASGHVSMATTNKDMHPHVTRSMSMVGKIDSQPQLTTPADLMSTSQSIRACAAEPIQAPPPFFSRQFSMGEGGDDFLRSSNPLPQDSLMAHGRSPVAGMSTKTGAVTECLITPQSLLQTAATTLPVSMAMTQGGACGGVGSVLLSPMVFQASSRLTPPTGNPVNQPPVTDMKLGDNKVNPLNQQQLQQALIFLIKNDAGFLASIHEAYVQSLRESLSKPNGDRS